MYVTKEKLVIVFFILVTIGIVLAIGFLLTGKVPEEIFKESEKESDKDKKEGNKEGYETANTQYSNKIIDKENTDPNSKRNYQIDNHQVQLNPDDTNVNNYNKNNYDVEYHEDAKTIYQKEGRENPFLGTLTVRDKDRNLVSIPWTQTDSVLPTYYQPGSFVFGSTNYVPNYEDSVYLSRTTGLSTVRTATPSSLISGGFCNFYKNDSITLEEKCNLLDTETCASVSCCVLMGGSKCVSGDDKGPHMKSNYTDPTIVNKDVYYYHGKCYGNCRNE